MDRFTSMRGIIHFIIAIRYLEIDKIHFDSRIDNDMEWEKKNRGREAGRVSSERAMKMTLTAEIGD